jgi:metallo-beta-lactamase class B
MSARWRISRKSRERACRRWPSKRTCSRRAASSITSSRIPLRSTTPVVVDKLLKDGDTITLGGVTLTARHTPGHTRGCTTFLTSVEDGGRTYSVVFPGSLSVNPGTRLVKDPSYPGIADDYRRSMRLLESLRPDIFLAAHASVFNLEAKRTRAASDGAKAFVDPDGYRRWLENARAAFDTLIAAGV